MKDNELIREKDLNSVIDYFSKWYEYSFNIFLDEINKVSFEEISSYEKSKYIFNQISNNLTTSYKLAKGEEYLVSTDILRMILEDIIYIIYTSSNNNVDISYDIKPSKLRNFINNNFDNIFNEYLYKDCINNIYSFLSKTVHISNVKEYISLLLSDDLTSRLLKLNLIYLIISVEYIYLIFLNKKLSIDFDELNYKIFKLCDFGNNFISIYTNYILNIRDDSSNYFNENTNSNYFIQNNERFNDILNRFKDENIDLKKEIIELGDDLKELLNDPKYFDLLNKYI